MPKDKRGNMAALEEEPKRSGMQPHRPQTGTALYVLEIRSTFRNYFVGIASLADLPYPVLRFQGLGEDSMVPQSLLLAKS